MRAGGAEGAVLARGCAPQNPRAAAEAEDLAAVRGQLVRPGRHHRVGVQLSGRRRQDEFQDGVDDGGQRGQQAGAEQKAEQPPASGAVGARFRRILLHRCFAHRLLRAPRPPRREDVGDCTRQTARVNAIMNTGRGACTSSPASNPAGARGISIEERSLKEEEPMDGKRTGVLVVAILLAGVVALPALAKNVKLPEGKKIHFTLNQTLSSDKSREGDKFSGVVSRNVRVGDKTVIPEGAVVRGTVTSVKRSGRVKGKAEMELSFDEIELPDGKTLD